MLSDIIKLHQAILGARQNAVFDLHHSTLCYVPLKNQRLIRIKADKICRFSFRKKHPKTAIQKKCQANFS